jgi:hypothetical protein
MVGGWWLVVGRTGFAGLTDQSVFESQNFLNRKGRKEAQRKTRETLHILKSVSKIF